MSDIYSPDTPAARRDRIIRAAALTGRCSACGSQYRKSNLLSLKDGRTVCPDCFDAVWSDALDTLREGEP